MTEIRRILPFLVLPLVLILAGCGILSSATPVPPSASAPTASATPAPTPSAAPSLPVEELTPIPGVTGDVGSAHEAWVARAITSYTWQVHYRCFCPDNGALTVTVKDGSVVSVTDATGPVASDTVAGFPLTIDGLYAQLAGTNAKGGSVTGTFDEGGVPSRLSVDPIKNAADDEYGVEVLSFSPAV